MEGDIHRIRVLEAISILRCDAGMSMRAIEEAKIVKERSMRLWVAGKKENQKIRVQHIEALEYAVQARGLVPWSRHYFPMSDAMWETAGAGGQEQVVHSLRNEETYLRERQVAKPADKTALCEELADVQDALRCARQKNPLMAQGVRQKMYLDGAARKLEQRFGNYAAMLMKHFSGELPKPEEASPEDWTGVLHLMQYLRDTQVLPERQENALENKVYVDCARWLRHACDQFNRCTWARVVALHTAEAELILAPWEKITSFEERKRLLRKLRWFKRQSDYHERVEGNYRAVRNALATASATLQEDQYAELHRKLAAHDEAWKNPKRMRAFGKLDGDFDHFIAWVDEHEEVLTDRKGRKQETRHDDR